MASHCQSTSNKRETISYVKANGMSAFAPNLTITSNGSCIDVEGNGFAPYYIVYDHTGKLHYHHMCGSYHGGDGTRFIEIVDELVAKAPAIYLGPTPFKKVAPLAAQVSKGKGLGAAMKAVTSKLALKPDAETKAELERLGAVLTRYRDRKLVKAGGFEGAQPSRVVSALRKLLVVFKGSSLATDVERKLAEMEASTDLKTQVGMEKKYRGLRKKYDKTKEKKRTDAYLASLIKKLDKLLAGNEELPFAATVESFLGELR